MQRRKLDDAELVGDFRALRTIQAPDHYVWDERLNAWRVSSAAFGPGSDGSCSIDLEQLLVADGHGPTARYPNLERAVGLIAHKVSRVLDSGLTVHHEPLDDNYYHGAIRGQFTRKRQRDLARDYEVIVQFDVVKAAAFRAELMQSNQSVPGSPSA